jgi:NADH:ubiquinone oxidoreductase subunit F (NADH-binding)
VGAFGAPTIVNNLETLATVPTIIEMGGENFSKLSRLHHIKDGGVRLYGVSGHVKRPGVYEAPVGITLNELIHDLGGGMRDGLKIKAVVPGGSSTPVLREVTRSTRPTRSTRCTRGTARATSTCPWASTPCAASAPCSAPAAPS